jgi:gas vesicle protein
MAFSKSSTLATALVGAAGGALALYFMDPAAGKERRQRVSGAANDLVNQARQHVQQHIDSLADLARSHAAAAQQAATGAAHDAMDPLRAAAASQASRATTAASDARQFASNLWDKAQATIEEARHRGHHAAAILKGDEEPHSSPVLPVALTAVAFCAAGVGLMWALDPDRGRSRRAQLGQRAQHIVSQTGKRFHRTGRHLRNRLQGYAAVAGRRVREQVAEASV